MQSSSSPAVPAVSSLSYEALVDKIKGVIFGNALGDAVGLATEFQSKAQVIQKYGADKSVLIPFPSPHKTMHSMRWDTGDWTDDTDQMILILQTLLNNDLEFDRLDFSARLVEWMYRGFPELGDQGGMGIGMTVGSVLNHPKFRSDPHAAANLVWEKYDKNLAANGAVMRTSILGVVNFQDLTKVAANAEDACRVTHADTRCIANCLAVTRAIALILQGRSDVSAAASEAIDFGATALDTQFLDEYTRYMNYTTVEELKLDDPKAIGYTFKCAGSAFYCLHKAIAAAERAASSEEAPILFKEIINDVVREGGDADTNGAVCGALVGAYLGYNKLPVEWLRAMPNKAWLDTKVDRLLLAMKLK